MKDETTLLPDEAVAADPQARPASRLRTRFGGTEGNEILTSASALVLTLLLLAEGVTILRVEGLRGAHMFIGLVLIPPLLVKLGSVGYRFARYYAGTRAYVEKGPPLLALRLLAPLLVAATIAVFVTGVILMIDGRRRGNVFQLHKLSFIAWGVLFGIHFLAYLPRMVRSLQVDWSAARRQSVPGSGARAMLVAASIGGGVALALALLPQIDAWKPERFFFH